MVAGISGLYSSYADFAFEGFFQPLEGTPPSDIFSDHNTDDDIFFDTDLQDNLFFTDPKHRFRPMLGRQAIGYHVDTAFALPL